MKKVKSFVALLFFSYFCKMKTLKNKKVISELFTKGKLKNIEYLQSRKYWKSKSDIRNEILNKIGV